LQARAHWSKDFVEHLRTIHFALLAISAGLIIIVFSSKQYNAAAALVQIDEVTDLKTQWSAEWMQTNGKCDDVGPNKDLEASLPAENPMRPLVRVAIHGGEHKPWTFLQLDCPTNYWYQAPVVGVVWSPTSFPRTLREFKNWWGALDSGFVVYLPKTEAMSGELIDTDDPADDVGGARPIGDVEFALPHPDITKKPETVTLEIVRALHSEEFFYVSKWPIQTVHEDVEIRIPLNAVSKCVVSQNEMSRAYNNLHPGSFERTFADLSTAARDRTDFSLEEIKTFVHEEAAKGIEVFEAFGMKFPAGQITFWGILLLMSVQLYFFVYLRQLFGKLKSDAAGWDVPWIGMDSSSLSKMIFFFTVVVLPCAASVLLVWQAAARLSVGYWERTGHLLHPIHFFAPPWDWHYTVILKILGMTLAPVTSGFLGWFSWRFRPQVAAETAPSSSQLFE
jgi:hypothetical protein